MRYQYKLIGISPETMIVVRFNKRNGTSVDYMMLEGSRPDAKTEDGWKSLALLPASTTEEKGGDGRKTVREIMDVVLGDMR